MNIVLLEPELPSNTGNIGRTCTATATTLHLIEPLGFKLNEKAIKRSGLDYWDKLEVRVYSDIEDFYEKNLKARKKIYMATTKAEQTYCEAKFEPDDYIMFGKESAGIPEELLVQNKEGCMGTMGWCHGFKLHLLCNDSGEVITFCLTGANEIGRAHV